MHIYIHRRANDANPTVAIAKAIRIAEQISRQVRLIQTAPSPRQTVSAMENAEVLVGELDRALSDLRSVLESGR